MAQHLYKVIQSLANLVQQYFRLDGTPGSFYEYTRQVKVSSEILHKGSVGPQGIEVHEVGTVGIEELRVHFTPYLWPVSSAENKKGQSYWENHACLKPDQSLQALGCHVDAVCPKKKAGEICATAVHYFEGETYSEKRGHNFTLTADFEALYVSSYDALVIPGGRAPEYLALDEKVIALVKQIVEARKPIASICHGQQILAAAGVLQYSRAAILFNNSIYASRFKTSLFLK
ncbi:unnamed protein product [Prunus armeniaca]